MVGDILSFIEQVGIPITAALAVGWFLFIILKIYFVKIVIRKRKILKSINKSISLIQLF